MEQKNCLFFFLAISLMILLLISFATKGSHWDKIPDKSFAESNISEVYRSMEGLIAMDVLMIILCIPILIFYNKNNVNMAKVLFALLFLMLFTRFILGVIFLAGNNQYCKTNLEYYDNLDQRSKDMFVGSEPNIYSTLKGAWVFEIIAIILVDVCGSAILVLLYQKSKAN